MTGVPSGVSPPEPGRWLWTCRAGFEAPLFEELSWAGLGPKVLGAALLASKAPGEWEPIFARAGFRVDAVVTNASDAIAALPSAAGALQVWVPDTDAGNRLSGEATSWRDTISAARSGDAATPWVAFEANGRLLQVCLMAPGLAAVGAPMAREALTLAAGGRARMRRGETPSRAAMKLDEALEWARVSPGKGELCVDLGAAPGGWTRRLVELGSRVVSVDPAKLDADLARHAKVRHVMASAFDFEPEQPVDWLFCDMVWKPLEVSQLLGKWARRGWALQLVANLKLPMKDKLPEVRRALGVLEDAGWRGVKARQLYHDRDEVTVRAVRGL